MNILVLEHDQDSRVLLEQSLEPLGHRLHFADNEASALDFFECHLVDCFFIEMNKNCDATVAAIKSIRTQRQGEWFPILALCANLDDDSFAAAILAGADAVATKPLQRKRVLMQLIALERIYLARQNLQVNKDLLAANLALLRLSMYDEVTGLPNKRYFDETLDKEFRLASRTHSPLTVMMCEIEGWKRVVAAFGADKAGLWQQKVAEVIKDVPSRPTDLVSRYGEDVFALILPNTPEAGACRVADLLSEAIVKAMGDDFTDGPVQLRAFHIASATDDGKCVAANDLAENALKSLHAVKKTNYVLRNL